MPFKDIREFIAILEKEGEAQRIDEEVDWNLEAAAMLRRSHEADLPAPFFQRIKDYPSGYRLFGGTLANQKRKAIAMGMSPDTPLRELMEEYLKKKQTTIKPVLLNDGPCKENIHTGNEVDLLEFPVPMIHEGDGGRYIGTWHMTISKDLDSGWVNWGMYRHMLHDKNTLGIHTGSTKHLWGMYVGNFEPRNKPMEVAIAIGVEPVSAICAAAFIPYGVPEVDVAGGIRGEPVELVKCETVDLAVPATAEIVIEGEIRPNERLDEGPFGEFTGYVAGRRRPKPVIHVKAVTHRDNPILTISCMGVPVDDNSVLSLTQGVAILEALRARGLPITGVYVVPETSNLLTVIAVKNRYTGIADEIAHIIWGLEVGYFSPYLLIVEDDVDPFNVPQALHAMVTKCHPYNGIVKVQRSPISSLLPYLGHQERQQGAGPKVYFDCLWSSEWAPEEVPKRISFTEIYPSEIQQSALAKWQKYGY